MPLHRFRQQLEPALPIPIILVNPPAINPAGREMVPRADAVNAKRAGHGREPTTRTKRGQGVIDS